MGKKERFGRLPNSLAAVAGISPGMETVARRWRAPELEMI